MKRILSVSRRTDVPAFYGEWFMNRIREAAAGYRNPFGGKNHSISLAPEDVHFIVFWSKNYEPFLPHLEELRRRGFNFYFHFTITGLPLLLESNTPAWAAAAGTAHRLAEAFSPAQVLWRFDPIVFSTQTPPDLIRENFNNILRAVSGATNRCIFSFVDYYGKVCKNFEALHAGTGIRFRADARLAVKFERGKDSGAESSAFIFDLTTDEQAEFVNALASDAAGYGVTLYSCCEDSLVSGGNPPVLKGHCVDPDLIRELTGEAPSGGFNPTRTGCGCWESRDIGAYDTCPHGCAYCYANTNREKAVSSYSRLKGRPDAFSLSPGTERGDFPPVPPPGESS